MDTPMASLRKLITKVTWRGALSGLLCSLVCWSVAQLALVHELQDWIMDGVFSARGPRSTTTKIVLISLDDNSLQDLGKPLNYVSPELGEVISFLKEQGAAAIGLDLIIPEH